MFEEDNLRWALILYVLIAAPVEMLIHELGHFYFQKKFGVHVLFFKIGIFNIFKWRHRSGTDFILGIPVLKAESRGLGEVADKESELNNPSSFYYKNRHPRERFIISVAGALLAIVVSALLYLGYLLIAGTASLIVTTLFVLVLFTEFFNLLIPFKLPWFGGSIKNDAYIAFESLFHWIKADKRASQTKNPV